MTRIQGLMILPLVLCFGCPASSDEPPADNGPATDGVDVSADTQVPEDVLPTSEVTSDVPAVAAGYQATINGTPMVFDQTLLATIYADATGTQGETTLQGLALKPSGALVGASLELRIQAVLPGTYDCTVKYTGAIVNADTPYDKFSTSAGGTCTATILTTGKTGGWMSGTFEAAGTEAKPYTISAGTYSSAITLYNAPPQ